MMSNWPVSSSCRVRSPRPSRRLPDRDCMSASLKRRSPFSPNPDSRRHREDLKAGPDNIGCVRDGGLVREQ
ncbi:unnamed protein product [Ectocarpus fasciculatus]